MAEISEFVKGFVGVIIGVTIAVTLIPVVMTSIEAANLTGTTAIVVGMIPLFVGIGTLMFALRSLI